MPPKDFEKMLNVVEHGLSMYAYSYVHLPAHQLYETDKLEAYQEVINNCHIYLIGYTPIMTFVDARQEDNKLILTSSVLGDEYETEWPLPDGAVLHEEEGYHYIEDASGLRIFPSDEQMAVQLQKQTEATNFNVKYIGQAYGKDGSRNAIDRLMKHETLQKISLKKIPEGYQISLCLFEIQPDNKTFTLFNPNAQNNDDSEARINAGLEKLFNTNEQERVTLYEASLIRYFEPEFNKEFKNSFPSTNMKVLEDCYDKDFSAIIAEISFDNLPFYFCSDVVKPKDHHIVTHNLHDDEQRKVFFT